MADSSQFYKIKLASGRILGPIQLDRIRALILKNQLVGRESAREYPQGDWKDINLIAPIAEMIVAHAEGHLEREKSFGKASSYQPILGQQDGATAILTTEAKPLPGAEGAVSAPSKLIEASEISERTEIHGELSKHAPDPDDPDRTRVWQGEVATPNNSDRRLSLRELGGLSPHRVSDQPTVVFQRKGKKAKGLYPIFRTVMVVIAVAGMGWTLFSEDPAPKAYQPEPSIRPRIPAAVEGKADPGKSTLEYQEGLKFYLLDQVVGYKRAAERFQRAAALDPNNVKALAMLASSYLNLIDSSNKDENFFSVISKLIDMTRAKAVDLPETVIADVEFYLTINRDEAAQNTIVAYTKTHQTIGLEMFYYLALTFFDRGEYREAANYISQIPDNKVFSAKVNYLRGEIAEKLNDSATAMGEYKKALKINPQHVKSHLRIAALFAAEGKLKDASPHLDFIINHAGYLSPKDLGLGFYLHAQLAELYNKYDIALVDMERATRLDKNNHDYSLELYTLRAKEGGDQKALKAEARMYYYLGEGEKLVVQAKYQEALVQFLQARQQSSKSILPLVKAGDMFSQLHDLGNAALNYKKAAELLPTSIEIWSKYMDILIQSYEWEDAQKAMDRFRQLPVPQSFIDKLAADLYAKQGAQAEAQNLYRKAMSRDSIDPSVYVAYAKSLMATKNFKEAPFFFALARRFDPSNIEAIVGTAKCIANTDSIDRAITMLEDELQKGASARGDILSAIAELQIQSGNWAVAQQTVEQAMAANPDLATPWKLQAQIDLNKEGLDHSALDKALLAYKAYSDRNTSDPSGYMERYRIFIKKTQFDRANEELEKIYGIYPKFPNLHYFKGLLYSLEGNHKVAIEELGKEIKNNERNASAQVELGKELILVNSVQEAIPHFTKAMQLAPQAAEPKIQLGYANYLLKNYPSAVALYQAALATDGGNANLYRRLGFTYQAMGNGPAAAEAFRKYIQMEPDAPDRAEFEKYR